VVLIGRIATAVYFLFFPFLYLLGKIEKPRALPQSISAAVLKAPAQSTEKA